ncbi:MAG: recombinase family protein [Sandaracinaceae bacterium]|nr:recombinase family protein [Sandaracinaceae bacterium]
MGLRTRGTRRFPSGPVSVSGLYALLRNPFYTGVLRCGGDVYEGAHEPAVSRDEFAKIEEILAGHTTPRPKRHAFTYRGLLTCGHCGRGITAEEHRKRSGRRFVYYRCTQRWRNPDVCPRPFLNEVRLEDALAENLALLDVPERFATYALNWIETSAKKEDEVTKRAQVALEQELARSGPTSSGSPRSSSGARCPRRSTFPPRRLPSPRRRNSRRSSPSLGRSPPRLACARS